MSAVELDDLEAARDELAAVEMAMVAVNLSNPAAREELMPAMLKVDGVVETLNRAIEAGGRGNTTSDVRALVEGGSL